MGLIKQLLQTLLMWSLLFILVILIVLFPREIEYTMGADLSVERHYEFTWGKYKHTITTFINGVVENKSLGQSRFNRPVEEEIKIYMSRSLSAIGLGFVLAIVFGVLKGIYDFRKANTRLNVWGHGTTWLFQSIPDFFLVILVQIFFVWLIIKGIPSISIFGHDKWYSFIVPGIIISIYPLFYLARVTSSLLAGQEKSQYLQTAKAKGLTERMILYKHALGNCWGIILTQFSTLMAFILSNLLIVEYLLYFKGAAYRLYEALGYSERQAFFVTNYIPPYEGELVIGLLLSFMLLILIAQIISQIARYYTDPIWRKEHD